MQGISKTLALKSLNVRFPTSHRLEGFDLLNIDADFKDH